MGPGLLSPKLALNTYRALAYIVGTGLIILVFIGVPLRYLAGHPIVVDIVGPIHGFLYIVYLFFALNAWFKFRLPFWIAVLCLLAGLVPTCSFIAEHYVTKRVRGMGVLPA